MLDFISGGMGHSKTAQQLQRRVLVVPKPLYLCRCCLHSPGLPQFAAVTKILKIRLTRFTIKYQLLFYEDMYQDTNSQKKKKKTTTLQNVKLCTV